VDSEGMMANIMHRIFIKLMFERPAKTKTYQQYKHQFEQSTATILELIGKADDTEKSRWELTHVIGMECWMQSRMKVGLGEPFIQEEYDGYRPSQDTSWQDLRQMFVETRQTSCDICVACAEKNVDGSQKVAHNQFGDLSVRGWMEYALFHSKGHAGRMTSK